MSMVEAFDNRCTREQAEAYRDSYKALSKVKFRGLKLSVSHFWLSSAVRKDGRADFWSEYLDELCEFERQYLLGPVPSSESSC